MKTYYYGSSNKPAIYEIRNRYTNRSYIGQTVHPKTRSRDHLSSLKKERHKNQFLQADYFKCLDKLNHDNFLEFHVLETLPDSTQKERNDRELYWLKMYAKNGYSLYNLDKECNGRYVKSKETREKISKALTGKRLSAAHKASISANAKSNPNYGLKGKHHSDATKKIISDGRLGAKHWHYGKKLPADWTDKLKTTYEIRLTSPSGKVYDKVVGLTDFAHEHGLSLAGLRFLLSGQRKTHKGWKRADDPIRVIELDPKTKVCSQCKEEKSISLFNNKTASKDGKRAHCKMCQKKYRK